MNKKMRELLEKMNALRTQAKAFMADGENKDVAKATDLLNQADALQAEYEAEKRLYEAEKEENKPTVTEIQEKNEKEENKGTDKGKEEVKKFIDLARRGFPKAVGIGNEGTLADGGYTVPEDISTKILKYRELKPSLLSLVDYEKVTTNKGERTYKKRSQQTGFTKVGEKGTIGGKNAPQFERLAYEIEKYAGWFAVTDELLADSDNNIEQTMIEWIGDESRITANNLILAQIKTKSAVDLVDFDGIRKAFIVTLGQTFLPTSSLITNDDGLLYLSTLKDANGRDLLQPNPTDPTKTTINVGFTTVPVKVLPNDVLKTETNKIPMICGDLKEAIKYWDRALFSVMSSNVAVVGTGEDALNAFEQDLTLWRAIEREDVTGKDASAYVNGYIDTTEKPVETATLTRAKATK